MRYLIVLGIVAGIIALMVQYPHTMLSPGELTQAHQDLSNDCFSCHAPFGGVQNDKCIVCHQLDEIGAPAKNRVGEIAEAGKILFHEKLSNQACTACHTDHRGVAPEGSLDGFKHNVLPETVIHNCASCHPKPADDLHRPLNTTCSACHHTEDWKLSAKFDHDMITAAEKDHCTSCHQNPDDKIHRQSNAACSNCHSTDKWVPATFDHDDYFLLDQDHNARCNICHISKSYDTYTCYGCHEHSESSIRSEHREEGIYNFTNCVSCHRSADEHDIGSEGRSNKSDQERNGKKKESGKEEEDD